MLEFWSICWYKIGNKQSQKMLVVPFVKKSWSLRKEVWPDFYVVILFD